MKNMGIIVALILFIIFLPLIMGVLKALCEEFVEVFSCMWQDFIKWLHL
jgi:hypothetical protein